MAPESAPAQVVKSLLKAVPISVIMSVVVVERPYFWKAWWLHSLVSVQAPQAATRSGLELQEKAQSIKGFPTGGHSKGAGL